MERRCILCGRLFEIEEQPSISGKEDSGQTSPKSVSVCQLCQAKLKHEAEEQQKIPKPI